MKVFVRQLLRQLDDGTMRPEQLIERLRIHVGRETSTRLGYVRENYWYDSMVTGAIFNKKRGTMIESSLVHCGYKVSPIHILRAKWFLIVGDDPGYQVRVDPEGEMYALYSKGGDQIYARDLVPEDRKHLLPKPHMPAPDKVSKAFGGKVDLHGPAA